MTLFITWFIDNESDSELLLLLDNELRSIILTLFFLFSVNQRCTPFVLTILAQNSNRLHLVSNVDPHSDWEFRVRDDWTNATLTDIVNMVEDGIRNAAWRSPHGIGSQEAIEGQRLLLYPLVCQN